MGTFELVAIVTLIVLAFGDLFVGVVNDAVNFLSSAIGAKVSSRVVIMIFAGIGILIGATFSDGIIEVARKGIFFPEYFSATEAIILFTSVAIAEIILLDLFSTFGLPTSTTVSVVFELLGAAFVLACWKLGGIEEAWQVINSASAMKIIIGIFLSIAVAFVAGLVVQFFSRLVFTFEYKEKFKRWGFIWSGIALTALLFFILIKGGKHASFMTDDIKEWITSNTQTILICLFAIFTAISFVLIKLKVNLLKIIVLIGTASLAMAFAGNDLANFIGVSVAGTHAYLGSDLTGSLPTPTWILLIAGIVMIIALVTSKKARTVTDTTLNLSSHENHVKNQWKSNVVVRKFTELIGFMLRTISFILPERGRKWVKRRWTHNDNGNGAAFDLLRAAVNLMVAAAVISYATSFKLPLSTTYVTFMVAMGTALADNTWKKDCAPSRLTGIFTVIGGWVITGIFAFIFAGITVSVLYWAEIYGLIALVIAVMLIVYKLSQVHKKRDEKMTEAI